MARYIDVEKVHIPKGFFEDLNVPKLLNWLKSQPTADVVEVVRCKECKHSYINSFSAQSGVALCKFWSNRAEGNNLVVQQDDYCSYGERKCDEW